MTNILKNKYFILGLRLLVGTVFLYAAWSKIEHPHQFGIAVRGYQIIPVSVSNLFAVSVAWIEAVAGAFLILGLFTRASGGAVMILLGIFIVAVGAVLVRGMAVDCGCFKGEGGATTGPLLIVRNVGLLFATFLVTRYDQGFLGLSSLFSTPKIDPDSM